MYYYKLLEIVDLPSDPNGSFGKFRRELLKAYNANRMIGHKMRSLEKTLEFVLEAIKDGNDDRLLTAQERQHDSNQAMIDSTFDNKPKRATRTRVKETK